MQTNLLLLLNGPIARGTVEGMARGGLGGPGGFLFGGLLSVLWTVVIVLAVLWVTRNWSSITSYFRRTATSLKSSSAPVSTQTPLEILQTRYAKGEITREEYETIRRDLTGEPAAAPTVENVTAQA